MLEQAQPATEAAEDQGNGIYPGFLIEQAKAHGVPVDVWVRMQALMNATPKIEDNKIGGVLGNAAHLGSYTWEGIAFRGLYEMLEYLFKTLILPPHLKEMGIYDSLPNSSKYIPNEAGVYPDLYQPYYDARGQLKLDVEGGPIAYTEDTPPSVLWANGFMPEPTEEMGLRNRFDEWVTSMTGSKGPQDFMMNDIFAKIAQGQGLRPAPSNRSGIPDAIDLSLIPGH